MLFLLACQTLESPSVHQHGSAQTDFFSTIETTVGELIPTVIDVHTQTSNSASVSISVFSGQELLYTTKPSVGTQHRFILGGFSQQQEISMQLTSEEEQSGVFTQKTGSLSFQPQIFVEQSTEISGHITTVLSGEEQGIAIWSPRSDLLWALDLSSEERRPVQAHYLPSSGLIAYNLFSNDRTEPAGEIVVVNLLGEEQFRLATPWQHHAFTPIDPQTFAYLKIAVQNTDEYGPVVGDEIVIASAEEEHVLFSAWDHFSVAPTPVWDLPFYPQGKDWTHASGLTYNAEEELLTLSLMGIQGVLNIALDGEIEHIFGGTMLSSNAIAVVDPPLVRPHGAVWQDQELSLFHSPNLLSRGSVLQLTPEPTWTEHFMSDVHALALGDIQRLSNDLTLVNFGTAGQLKVYDSTAAQVLHFENAIGAYFSHAKWITDLYQVAPLEQ